MTQKPENSQAEKFKVAAKEAGCDESETAFEAKLADIAKSPPVPKPKKRKKA